MRGEERRERDLEVNFEKSKLPFYFHEITFENYYKNNL